MSALLEIEGLETSYGSSQVLFGVSLSVAESEVATLLGRNGMGKTTTVRSICGLEKPGGGSIRFSGQRIDGWTLPAPVEAEPQAMAPEGAAPETADPA